MLMTAMRILLVASSAYLYSLGGRDGTSKAIRRLGELVGFRVSYFDSNDRGGFGWNAEV
jgi:hypothetical protein